MMSEENNSCKDRQDIPDDGLIHLHDMSFDFEDYFDRYASEEMGEEERKEFGARVMGLFCLDFFNSGGDPAAIKPWVANYLAKAMYNVLGGVPWSQAIPTPFDAPGTQSMYTEKGGRGMAIYGAVENGKSVKAGVTNLLAKQAEKFNISFETARGDYYKVKKSIENGSGLPDGFLKKNP